MTAEVLSIHFLTSIFFCFITTDYVLQYVCRRRKRNSYVLFEGVEWLNFGGQIYFSLMVGFLCKCSIVLAGMFTEK